MKAAVCERYGPPEVVQLREVDKPVPRDNEILIRILATTVTSGDWRVRSLEMPPGFRAFARLAFGFSRPRQPILGSELAGEIEAVGKRAVGFKAGDQVFAFDGMRMGCHAQYKCMPADGAVALKPAALSYEEAAALSFGGSTALDFFRRGNVKSGERVLVNGASGAVGTAVVQLARHFGARVTGVCSAANAELVESLGAERVIDYAREDFTRDGETYDVIVDTAGTAPYARSRSSLKRDGRLLQVLCGFADLLRAPWISMMGERKIIAGPAAERAGDLRFLADLAQAGEFRPVIDRRYSLERIAEAHRYVDTGRKRGNAVITVEHGG